MPWYDEDEMDMPQYGDPEEPDAAIDPAAKLPLKPRRDALSSPPPPPADLSRLRDAVANPPPMPKPGMGRRILSGLAGGAAGWLNTTAGRPGGIAHPIDPSKAEENILGITGYKRKFQNWQLGTQALEKEATIAEKARQDDINSRLGEARIQETGAYRDALAESRKLSEQTRRDQQKTREDTANQAFESQTYTPEELGMTQGPPPGADNEFQDFPDGSPGPPPGYMPTAGPSSYKGGPRLRPTIAQVERNKKQADIDVATQAGPAISQEELDAFKDVGIVLPYKVGDHIPTPNYVQLQNQYRQAASAKRIADDKANAGPKPIPVTASEAVAMRAEGLDPRTPVEQMSQADADKLWKRQRPRPANPLAASGGTINDPKDIAAAIVAGRQSPVLTGLYRGAAAVRAELARAKMPDGAPYNHAIALSDWNAIQKHLATLNSQQQERLRQAITFTSESLPLIEELFDKWQKTGLPGGYKLYNKASLLAASHMPGEAGSIATNLLSQVNDLTSELGTVYKGGNASTDESLKLAASNLNADWNDKTFRDAIKRLKTNLQIRKNSILSSEAVGVSPNSVYNSEAGRPAAGAASSPKVDPKQQETNNHKFWQGKWHDLKPGTDGHDPKNWVVVQ